MSDEKSPSLLWLIGAISLVLVVVGLNAYFLFPYDARGTFGDMFGGVNALFTGLAFAVLIYTVWLQRSELVLQRKELEQTRDELKGQKEQLAAQNATLTRQRFENTFFQLLRTHGEIVNAIDIWRTKEVVSRGRDCFREFYRRLKNEWAQANTQPGQHSPAIEKAYSDFFTDNQGDLAHYFRHLYHVIRFVNESDIDDKRRYTNFVRAQLSSYELVLLFYNCLSPEHGRAKFKPLVEKFALLKNLSPALLLDDRHMGQYKPSAFGKEAGS
jgi:hypothetical protein